MLRRRDLLAAAAVLALAGTASAQDAVDVAKAKAEGKVVWYTSTPIEQGQKIVGLFEKAYGIKIPRGELFPEDVLSSAEFVTNGKVNAAGLAALKARMPFYDLTKFEQNPSVQNFPNMLTVEDMVRYVQSKLAA